MEKQTHFFQNEAFGSLEVLMIGDKPYFPSSECATMLGYKNPRKAVIDHCRGVTKRDSLSRGGKQERNYIPEGDLYRLIVRSKLPEAEKFEAWIFDDIVPSIRRCGIYVTNEVLQKMIENSEYCRKLLDELNLERVNNELLETLLAECEQKVEYCEHILQSDNVIPISLIAKDYGMSAAGFNRLLHGLGIQFKIGGTWLLYQKYTGKDYTVSYTHPISLTDSVIHTYWTEKGRMFIYEMLKECGIVPSAQARG